MAVPLTYLLVAACSWFIHDLFHDAGFNGALPFCSRFVLEYGTEAEQNMYEGTSNREQTVNLEQIMNK